MTVAKSFDAPIKLLFPNGINAETGKPMFSMLGLGGVLLYQSLCGGWTTHATPWSQILSSLAFTSP